MIEENNEIISPNLTEKNVQKHYLQKKIKKNLKS